MHIKPLLVVLGTLLATLACSNATPQEVIVVTATPTETLETSEMPTPHPGATPRPTPTPRAWPFSDSEGDWTVYVSNDPLTDRENIVARLEAGNRSYLLVGCGYAGSDEVEVVVGLDNEIEKSLIEVNYSLDEGPIETETWSTYTNKRELFSRSPVELVWRIMNSQKLSIREKSGQTLILDIGGLANSLFPYHDTCNWIDSGAVSKKANTPAVTSRPRATPLPTPGIDTWPMSDSKGDWIIDSEIDPDTNEETIVAALSTGPWTDREVLVVRCGYGGSENVEAAVGFGSDLAGTFLVEVQFRFDYGPPKTERWSPSTAKTALFAPSPAELIWQIMNSQRFIIREEGRLTLEFDVAGLGKALYPHRDKCDWIGVGTFSKKVNRPTPTPAPTATPRPTNLPAPVRVGGAPLPEEFTGGEEIAATASTTDMMAIGADGLSGTLHLIQIERQTKVTVTLDNAGPGPYAAVIRRGGCPDEGGEPDGQFEYILFDIVDGQSLSMVGTPAQFFQFSLAYVIVVDGEDLINDPPISCGNIPSPLR